MTEFPGAELDNYLCLGGYVLIGRFVCMFVCLSVCLKARFHKNKLDFHKTWWKGVVWVIEVPNTFSWGSESQIPSFFVSFTFTL